MNYRRPMVAGNWKMNGDIAFNEQLLGDLRDGLDGKPPLTTDVVVCPPYPYLGLISGLIKAKALGEMGVSLGAQNIAAYDNGAYTGEVSNKMLSEVGCQWAIVGHSERRALLAETDKMIAMKVQKAIEGNMGVIVCVGESLDDRENDKTEAVLGRQIDAVGPVLAHAKDPSRVVIAYEPVWAIGTGKTASPDMAQQAHAFIRGRLERNRLESATDIRILYGGSVKPDNAASLFEKPDIDGGLIGGASLVAADFLAICRAAPDSRSN